MFLTNDELNKLRIAIESQTNIDPELLSRCGDLLHLGKYDEAVRSAFVLLEERLRVMMGEEGMTGANLANAAFNKDGPLSKHLGKNISEREGLRELYSGAIKVFRNPSAHTAVGYDSSDGKEIVSLINLLLRILKRAENLPAPGYFPENLENAFLTIEEKLGASATSRLREFLGRCMREGILPQGTAKQSIPFQRHANYKAPNWKVYKPHKIAMFYLIVAGPTISIHFPVNFYYSKVLDFNTEYLIDHLSGLGFFVIGRRGEYQVDLKNANKNFFEGLENVVMEAAVSLDESLAMTNG